MRLDGFKNKTEALKWIRKNKGKKTNGEAEKYLRLNLPKESYYQTKIIAYLKKTYPDAFVWKEAAGPYSRAGIPDVSMVLKGKFYAFEVKRPYVGVTSEIQKKTIRELKKAGATAGVVTFVEDVKKLIGGNKR